MFCISIKSAFILDLLSLDPISWGASITNCCIKDCDLLILSIYIKKTTSSFIKESRRGRISGSCFHTKSAVVYL